MHRRAGGPPRPMAKRLLLIGWDAADWKLLNPLMDGGEMPALNELVDAGIAGDLLACRPLNGAALWTSLATGKRPWQHGVTHSFELAADGRQLVPVSRAHRRGAALWEMLAARGLRSLLVGWPATHGSKPDLVSLVSNRYSEPTAPPGIRPWPPAIPGTYWPENLGSRLDQLRVSPEDIGADILSRYVPQWQNIDQKRDSRLGQLRVLLAPDLSHFAALGALIQSGDWDFAAVRFPALGHLARLFLPFQAPRRAWISEQDFGFYHDVIRIECRMLDQSLAMLRKLATPDTAVMVVSAHGTRPPDIPPFGFPPNDEDGWKSAYGLIAAAGPGLARDGLLQGASALDIAPTILTWFGLALGDDMEGRVLAEGFAPAPAIQRIPTWESAVPPSSPAASPPTATGPGAERLQLQIQWNFIQSCLEAGRLKEALLALEQLFQKFPERADFCHALFDCQLNLGKLAEAEETLEVLTETVPAGPLALLPRAELALARRDTRQARRLVEELSRANLTHPALLRRLGLLLLRLREWEALAQLAQSALERERNDPIAWLGLAEASLRLQKPTEAEAAARHAIQLQYLLPDAHFVLARALVAQSKWDEARAAMSALRKIQPGNRAASEYEKRLSQPPP